MPDHCPFCDVNNVRMWLRSDSGLVLWDAFPVMEGQGRAALDVYRPILLEIQAGRCFYCRRDLSRGVEVDHFIPWSRYRTDLGHDFVLSHPACNNAKSDHIAAEEHLAAWAAQLREHASELQQRLTAAELPHDIDASIRVAQWAYEQTERAHGQVWVRKTLLRHLSPDWRQLLVA